MSYSTLTAILVHLCANLFQVLHLSVDVNVGLYNFFSSNVAAYTLCDNLLS
jgi:hypothetical protein